MDEFIKYLLVTNQLDEVFWGKKKEEQENDTLKRTLIKDEKNQDNIHKNSSLSTK